MKGKGIYRVAIGIGDGIARDELEKIAGGKEGTMYSFQVLVNCQEIQISLETSLVVSIALSFRNPKVVLHYKNGNCK